jgi:hypothetical protein
VAQSTPDFSQACWEAIPNAEKLQVLASKVSLGTAAPTLQMQALETKPDDADKAAIVSWAQSRQECFQASEQWARQVHMPPGLWSVREGAIGEADAAIAALYRGELTFGQFNVKREEMTRRNRQRYASAVEDYERQARQDQAARQQAAAAFWANRPQPEPMTFTPMPVRPAPTQTNCQQIGTQLYCTSY